MMKRPQKLNGWQRLWVVIAAMSFLYTLGCSLLEGAKHYQLDDKAISAFEKPECKYIVDMPAGYKLDREPSFGTPCWHLHQYRSIYKDARNTKDGYIQHMNSLRYPMMLGITGFYLVVWLVSIGLLYGAGKIVAWIIKGFRSNAAG